jgi:hypothetical protein
MDVATSVIDEGGGPLTTKGKRMEQIALKLGDKTLEQKLELTDNLVSALDTNIAVYATPSPATTVLTGKAKAIRDKLVELSDAEAVVTKINTDLANMEDDLDASLTLEGSYIQNTSGGDLAKLSLLPVELKSHGAGTTAPGPITNFRLSPGVNPGEVKVESDPEPGAISYEHQQIPDITKPDVTVMLGSSSGCRTVIPGFTSGSHIWVQRRSVGGKKTGKGPWCTPSVVTVP